MVSFSIYRSIFSCRQCITKSLPLSTALSSQSFHPLRSFSLQTALLQEIKFSKDHEWVKMSADMKNATIGVSNHAQEQLGDVVYVELPEVGTAVAAHDVIGSLESVKAVSDVFSPISGSVSKVNEALSETPNLVNQKPMDEGWLYELEVGGELQAEWDGLMSESDYDKFLADEEAS